MLAKEVLQARCLKVEVDHEHSVPPTSEDHSNIGKQHGPANTTLVRVECYYCAHIMRGGALVVGSSKGTVPVRTLAISTPSFQPGSSQDRSQSGALLIAPRTSVANC